MSAKDPLLSRVLNWVWRGWPKAKVEDMFKPFVVRQHELSAYKGCLLWGYRVVIPNAGQAKVLHALHEGHPGIVRMKALARSYVWWPKMDEVIEKWVKNCVPCQSTRHAPPKAPVHPWEVTRSPWSRLHIDFAGPFHGQMFFLVVDSFSKWLEVVPVTSATSVTVIKILRSLFATHGLPDTIVSDNGTQFTSSEFKIFMESNLIRHVTIAPFHPSSNGQAERMVQTTKDSLKRIIEGDWNRRLANFLLQQHVTPCSSTGRSPAELLMNRRLKTCLDRLHPDLTSELQEKQELQFNERYNVSTVRVFVPDSAVYVRNYAPGPRWIPAQVLVATGPLSYKVQTTDGRILRRHVDQIRERSNEIVPAAGPSRTGSPVMPDVGEPLDDAGVSSPGVVVAEPVPCSPQDRAQDDGPADGPGETAPTLGRPRRNIHPPSYLKDFEV
ncbi:uncharacterized protein K02A2.6-like [Spea bombifrons]|uniref:uncharacterized protein K02A2.6-like n=1 Tax=Spea bombifrons TaxID=233779 RepID=UPI00234B4C6A|nr:uncharacterized protein K02A2.6-like [Spea bombifrons]